MCTENIYKYKLAIYSGHKKREQRVGTFLRKSTFGVENCIIPRRFSVLIKNNTTKKKMRRISHSLTEIHFKTRDI